MSRYFHRVCIQSGIVRKKLGFEARCYNIVIYLNVGTFSYLWYKWVI
jgi:hypothetical protein